MNGPKERRLNHACIMELCHKGLDCKNTPEAKKEVLGTGKETQTVPFGCCDWIFMGGTPLYIATCQYPLILLLQPFLMTSYRVLQLREFTLTQ